MNATPDEIFWVFVLGFVVGFVIAAVLVALTMASAYREFQRKK